MFVEGNEMNQTIYAEKCKQTKDIYIFGIVNNMFIIYSFIYFCQHILTSKLARI